MHIHLVVATLAMLPAIGHAQTCMTTVTDKHLSGAAKNSFLDKCKRDTQTRCEASAAEKKLAGAAKNSFTTKCVNDGVGS